MNKNSALKVVYPILGILILNQPCSGLLLSVTDWEFFEDLHVVGGVLLLVFVVVHLMLNWKWVTSNFSKKA
jgi:thiosulfate reductase cytochrome b subunit